MDVYITYNLYKAQSGWLEARGFLCRGRGLFDGDSAAKVAKQAARYWIEGELARPAKVKLR